MKKSIFISAITVLSVVFIFNVRVASAQYSSRQDLKKIIAAAVNYPQYALEHGIEGEVLVSFVQDENGKIRINEINSGVPELKTAVYEQLSAMQLPATAAVDSEPIYMRFSFKLL